MHCVNTDQKSRLGVGALKQELTNSDSFTLLDNTGVSVLQYR